MINLKSNKGSVTAIVLVTILFIIVILSSLYAVNASKRNNQLKAQARLKDVYASSVNVQEVLGN